MKRFILALAFLPTLAFAQTVPPGAQSATVPPQPTLQQQLDSVTGDITRQTGLLTGAITRQAQQIETDQHQIAELKAQVSKLTLDLADAKKPAAPKPERH